MTKCSVLPRGLGTLPAGSAVRVKSRLALYSVRAVVFAARLAGRFAVLTALPFAAVFALRFVTAPGLGFVGAPALRFVGAPALRFVVAVPEALFAPRFAADFLACAGCALLDGLFVAMLWPICQEHAPVTAKPRPRMDLWLLSTRCGDGGWHWPMGQHARTARTSLEVLDQHLPRDSSATARVTEGTGDI
jgi:hypothetical protein